MKNLIAAILFLTFISCDFTTNSNDGVLFNFQNNTGYNIKNFSFDGNYLGDLEIGERTGFIKVESYAAHTEGLPFVILNGDIPELGKNGLHRICGTGLKVSYEGKFNREIELIISNDSIYYLTSN